MFDPNDLEKFIKLNDVQTQTATSSEEFVRNVKINAPKKYKGIQALPTFGQVQGNNRPIALLGGGPSIKKEVDKIKDFVAAGFPTIACGSSHDYLLANGIVPTYCTICDPDPLSIHYLKRHDERVKYLLALSLHPDIFEHLKERDIYVWNCRSDVAAEEIKDYIHDYVEIMGGCTVGLRSISIAMCLGHNNIHFWGFDSCMGSGDEHHAYEFETKEEEVGTTYPVRFGSDRPEEGGKYYVCSGYQLAQAWHFLDFVKHFGAAFTPTFHGEGMLGDFYAFLRSKAIQPQKAA
jgi:hypothetical protein